MYLHQHGELWNNNPLLKRDLKEEDADRVIKIGYPLINKSDKLPYHFIHAFRKEIQLQLGLQIPQGDFKGDIYMNMNETKPLEKLNGLTDYWVLDAGYKTDFTLKNWGIERFQQLVNILLEHGIKCVQIGKSETSHKHEVLEGVVNLVGQTSIREMIQLVYNSVGVITPVSFPMHLAAAVPCKDGRLRPCIVIAGGREPNTWEQYPGHQFIHTVGMLDCCRRGGCWKSRAERLNDGAHSDNSICPHVVKSEHSVVGRCMSLIEPEDVAKIIIKYHENR